MMLPVIEANRKFAPHGAAAQAPGSTNSVATLLATVPVGNLPFAVAVSPDGTRVYAPSSSSGNVAVIDTATNTVIATVPVGSSPEGVDVTPDGTRVYVANSFSASVSVISTATNTVIATIATGAGSAPFAFGKFITGAAAPPPPPAVTNVPVPTLSAANLGLLALLVALAAAVGSNRRTSRK